MARATDQKEAWFPLAGPQRPGKHRVVFVGSSETQSASVVGISIESEPPAFDSTTPKIEENRGTTPGTSW